MQDLTKFCADNLRAISNNHGVKLKATHAHELVASYCGYKSRAALLADTKHPLSNLNQSSIITLGPLAPLDLRRTSLQDLPPELPDTDTLREWFYSGLLTEEWFASKFWPDYEKLSKFLADAYLRENQMERVYRSPTGEGIKLERTDEGIGLIVLRFYQIPTDKVLPDGAIYVHEANIITTIILKRIAGYIGYAKPEVSAQIERLK